MRIGDQSHENTHIKATEPVLLNDATKAEPFSTSHEVPFFSGVLILSTTPVLLAPEES